MKKLLKVLLTTALLLPLLAAVLPNSSQAVAVETDDAQVDVYLHKRIFRDLRWTQGQVESVDNWEYDNGGLLIEEDQKTLDQDLLTDDSKPLNGAIFKVYDFSAEYLAALQAGQTPEEFSQAYMDRSFVLEQIEATGKTALTNPEPDVADPGAFVTRRQTLTDAAGNEEVYDGIAKLSLPRYQEGQDGAYLIIETGLTDATELNIDLEKKSAPMMVTFPVFAEETELTQIHLYPKNVGYSRDPYFYKLDEVTKEAGPIEGAKFVLYREVNGEKLYLDQSSSSDLRNQWVTTSGDPLADARITVFVSDETGLVTTNGRFLAAGTYYFEEVQAAEGYQIRAAEKRIEVVVPEDWDTEVTVNGQTMAEQVDGKVPQLAIESKTPRVYNQTVTPQENPQRPTLPDTKGETPTDSPASQVKDRTTLPQTGEQASSLYLLGLGLVAVSLVLWKKRKRS